MHNIDINFFTHQWIVAQSGRNLLYQQPDEILALIMRSGKSRKPRLLSHVVKAVKNLKENKGSSAGRITDQVRTLLNNTKIRPKPRNVVMQVRRALNHAVENGILLHRAGRYKVLRSRNIVPVDSLELCDIHSGRQMKMRKARGRRHSKRRRRRSRSHRRRRRSGRRHSRHSSMSEETPEPRRRRQQKRKPKNKVSFRDKANRMKNDKEKTAQEGSQKSTKTPETTEENKTKVSQRPKTPYVSFEKTMDADESDTLPKSYERLRRRRQPAGARNRSMSRPRSSKPSRQSRRTVDDAEIMPSTLIRSSRSPHRSPDRQQQKSSSDMNHVEHDDTSSESMPDDDDDNQERDTTNSYLN
ncbi:hypothetical protein CBL_01096 [Carabus blaptoides fortunei]